MRLVNLTNRTICIYDAEGVRSLYELPTSPPAISVDATLEPVRHLGSNQDIPVVRHQFRLTSKLPPPQPGVTYLVGWPVIQALLEAGDKRADLVAPDTGRGSAVRDVGGQIVGVRRFRVA